jgi:hypothetical protein
MIRGESIVFMLLKVPVIHCSVLNISNPSGMTLSIRVLARFPMCKTDLRNIQLRVFSLHFLDEGGKEFKSCCKIIT